MASTSWIVESIPSPVTRNQYHQSRAPRPLGVTPDIAGPTGERTGAVEPFSPLLNPPERPVPTQGTREKPPGCWPSRTRPRRARQASEVERRGRPRRWRPSGGKVGDHDIRQVLWAPGTCFHVDAESQAPRWGSRGGLDNADRSARRSTTSRRLGCTVQRPGRRKRTDSRLSAFRFRNVPTDLDNGSRRGSRAWGLPRTARSLCRRSNRHTRWS